MRNTIAALTVLFLISSVRADDWPQWRGPRRDGTSKETGLLKSWPKPGPALLWQAKFLGSGFSTPSVVGDRLYFLSNAGMEEESVRAISASDGKPVWTTQIGKVGNPDQNPKYPAARSTPTVDGDSLFALGSDGDLVCLETATGKLRQAQNLRTRFRRPTWKPGLTPSPRSSMATPWSAHPVAHRPPSSNSTKNPAMSSGKA